MENLEHYIKLINNPYFLSHGLFDKEQRVVDGRGKPVPWITLPAIDFLQERVPKDIFVFEYGSGYSTLWWANRARKVIAVEHEDEWYEKMKPMFSNNIHVLRHRKEEPDYAASICSLKRANIDVVVVDGRNRVECIMRTLETVGDSTVIILDDSEREYYRDGIMALRDNGYKEVFFCGVAHLVYYTEKRTSIFYKGDNCLGL